MFDIVGRIGSGCFTADTTPGAWAIGDEKPGSDPALARASGDFAALVWGFENGLSEWMVSADPATGKPEWRRVTNTWKHQVDKLAVVEFYAEGDADKTTVETLSATVEHPFFTEAGQAATTI